MKIRIADRVLVALAGLVLLTVCAGVVAQVFFDAKIIDTAGLLGAVFTAEEGKLPLIVIGVAAALLLIGLYCVCMLFRRRRGKKGFVMQQTENGELAIAIKAMEGLVHKCVECHPELKLVHTHLEPGKDGVTVDLRIALASGVSIPLAVGALQVIRQIRYRTNEEYREKFDTESKDERNRFIANKAWAWAGYWFVLIAAVGSIVFKLLGREDLMMLCSGGVCLMILLYWGSYMVLKKKY